MPTKTVPVSAFDLIVFGGTGDLARRKLLPGLYRRMLAGQMPGNSMVLALGRGALTTEDYRGKAREALESFVGWEHLDQDIVGQFLNRLEYRRIDAESDEGWPELAAMLAPREQRVRAYYLAVDPCHFSSICARIAAFGLKSEAARLVIEKPLGHDLGSAQALNQNLRGVFDERHVYRIDHYLGKETVQNLLALRFGNALFEPLWNARHIDHVQITVAERVGVEGRAEYYDRSGALRDMVQNHLLQLLCLIGMEPPDKFSPDAVRDEKLKVLRALAPINHSNLGQLAVRGQYKSREGGDGFREDVANPESVTESFAALKVAINNWRWAGTPFYLRTGKRLQARLSEIIVAFKEVPHSIFSSEAGVIHNNALMIRLQPDEGITLNVMIKDPGPGGMRLIEAPLNMTFAGALGKERFELPDAYERLVMDVIRGDQTLFMRGDEVEAAWRWIDPIVEAWAQSEEPPMPYSAGGTGPEEAHMLIHRDGRSWREIEA